MTIHRGAAGRALPSLLCLTRKYAFPVKQKQEVPPKADESKEQHRITTMLEKDDPNVHLRRHDVEISIAVTNRGNDPDTGEVKEKPAGIQ